MTGDNCQFGLTDGVSGNSPVNRSRFATTAADRLRILETLQAHRHGGPFGESSSGQATSPRSI